MPPRRSRFRSALFHFVLCACSLVVAGLLIINFGTSRISWERVIATDPQGWPWEFTTPLIDPTAVANQVSCEHWYHSVNSGWRVGVFNGSLILGRNRSLVRAARREIHFYKYGLQVAHGAVHGPYYSHDSMHLGSACRNWRPSKAFLRTPQGRMLLPVNTTIILPAWWPIPFLAIFPIYWLLTGPLRTYRRRRRGLCIHCAYNLTANTSGACPECGSPC